MYSRHFLQSENFRLPVSLICDLFSDIFNNFIQPFFRISRHGKTGCPDMSATAMQNGC